MTEQVTAAPPAADETTPAASTETSAAAQTATTDVKPDTADASTAEGDKAPSLFDAVKASLNKPDAPEATPASDAKPDSKETEAKAEAADEEEEAEDKGELSEDEKKVLSAKTQRRIQKLARQRDELKPFADRTRQLDAFLVNNNIPAKDAADAFELLALMRTNPQEALGRLREISYQLSLSVGETIPRDIQEKIDAGTIDEATGRELALARAKAGGLEKATETLTAQTRETQERQFKAHVTTAVNQWEATVSKRDPDFAAKRSLIETHFRALLQGGEKIASPEDAVRIMKEAYKRVNDNLKTFRPSTQSEVRTTAATTTAATAPEPKSLEDAIRRSFAA